VTAVAEQVKTALQWLERRGSSRVREDMRVRYGIIAPRAYGVPVGMIQKLAKELGRDHDLALALWETGWYEARLLTAYVDQPEMVTRAQMDRWARECDNWGVVDTLCFCLFDRSPHAWGRVKAWSGRKEEFVKRSGVVLLACLALHDRASPDGPFLGALPLLEKAATDERNFVRKGVSWAIRTVGGRNRALNRATLQLVERLAQSENPTARSIGKLGIRDLKSPALRRRLR
jgi:3-methyladenine DNA glycosylase AlkD